MSRPGPASGGAIQTGRNATAQAERPTALTAWIGANNNSERAHLAAVWRGQNHGFDRSAVWKRGGDWWKGRPGFRDYHGHHRHHPFIPDLGYVDERDDCPFDALLIGDLAPHCATLYGLSDWSSYGLPPAPPGCKWVWLDGDIALVQISDGYVIDIVRQVF